MSKTPLSFSVSVPGKIILMGEHSVVYNKVGIASAINKRMFLDFCENDDESKPICLEANDLNCSFSCDINTMQSFVEKEKPLEVDAGSFNISNPGSLNHGAYVELIKNFIKTFPAAKDFSPSATNTILGFLYCLGGMMWPCKIPLKSFKIVLKSELTIGAGTGSSAAYSVCVASAIYFFVKRNAAICSDSPSLNLSSERFVKFEVDVYNLESFSLEEKEIINRWAYCVEKIMHGTPSGLDNFVCLHGHSVLINTGGSGDQGKFHHIKDISNIKVLLINTGVPRSTSDQVQKLKDVRKCCPVPVDAVLHVMDIVAKEFIDCLKKVSSVYKEADVKSLYQKMETLIDLQQGMLGSLGTSHMRLDEICFITKRRGLHSKLTGAGGGGYAFTLVPPYISSNEVSQCIYDLTGSGFHVQEVSINAEGLTVKF